MRGYINLKPLRYGGRLHNCWNPEEYEARNRLIAEAIDRGAGRDRIAEATGLTPERIMQIWRKAKNKPKKLTRIVKRANLAVPIELDPSAFERRDEWLTFTPRYNP